MNTLTIAEAKKLIGKKIKWVGTIYEGNEGHFGMGSDGGIAVITAVDAELRRPITADTIEGSEINHVFNEWGAGKNIDKPLCYSDGDRYVSFEIIE